MIDNFRLLRPLRWGVGTLSSALVVAMVLHGCGDGGADCGGPFCVGPPEQPEASKLEAGPGNGQTGAPGRELSAPIQVLVSDDKGRPVSGVEVSFEVSLGGGSLSSTAARSDLEGYAQVKWTLGNQVGTQGVRATAADTAGTPLDGSPIELSAEAIRPPPAKLILRSVPSDTALNGIPFEQQPVVEVLDADDQPVPEVMVIASVGSGDGTVSGTTTVSSDAAGQATYTDLALIGPQGSHTLRFTVTDPALEVASGPVELMAGMAAEMSGVDPLVYEGTVNSPVTPGPSVVVKDAAGNGAPGVAVTFTPNRNGTVSPETAFTNDQGIAQVSWTLGSTANVEYSLTARIESSTIPGVRFTAMARAGAAGRLRVEVQPSSPTESGTAFAQQPIIQVVDQSGNPAQQPGLLVTATVSAGPTGSLKNGSATTDSDGQAVFSGLTLTGAVGNYTISFSAPGLTGATSLPVTLTAGPPARLAFAVLPSTAARSRIPLVIQPVLQIQDASGNPIAQAGTQVVASVSPEGTSLTGETVTTDANGRAVFTTLAITGAPGPKLLTFSAPPLQSASAQVTLPSVATVSVNPVHPDSVPVGTTMPTPLSFTLRDASTRPVADADFILSASSGGAVSPNPTTSDATGTVQLQSWTLGTTAGDQYVELKLPDGRIFRDSVVATPSAASSLVKISGDDPIQSAPTESVLPELFVVRVLDQYGNGVGNVIVQWSTCDGIAGDPVATDNSGYAGTTQPTGTQASGSDPFCTMATVSGLSGSPVMFHYIVTASSASASQLGTGETQGSKPSGPPPVKSKGSDSLSPR